MATRRAGWRPFAGPTGWPTGVISVNVSVNDALDEPRRLVEPSQQPVHAGRDLCASRANRSVQVHQIRHLALQRESEHETRQSGTAHPDFHGDDARVLWVAARELKSHRAPSR
jgi:hypothetical protein